MQAAVSGERRVCASTKFTPHNECHAHARPFVCIKTWNVLSLGFLHKNILLLPGVESDTLQSVLNK